MTTIDIIKKSLEMKDKYNSNIFELIEDLNIKLYKINDIVKKAILFHMKSDTFYFTMIH